MYKKITKISLVVFSSFFILLSAAGVTLAIDGQKEYFGFKTASKYAEIDSSKLTLSSKKPIDLIGNIIQTALSLLAIVFFILVLYAGFKWMIAFGNSENAEKAKGTLETALIGLAIIIASYAISIFILKGLGFSG